MFTSGDLCGQRGRFGENIVHICWEWYNLQPGHVQQLALNSLTADSSAERTHRPQSSQETLAGTRCLFHGFNTV